MRDLRAGWEPIDEPSEQQNRESSMPRVSHRLYPIHETPVTYDGRGSQQQQQQRQHQQHGRTRMEVVPTNHHMSEQHRINNSRRPDQVKESVNYVQLTPTLTARLRGARETQACIENDYYIPTTCCICETHIFCIQDANYVLCPSCKTVGPLEGGADTEFDGGVGLGFTFEDLLECQTAILARRRADATPHF